MADHNGPKKGLELVMCERDASMGSTSAKVGFGGASKREGCGGNV